MSDTPIFDMVHWAYQNRFLYVGHLPADHPEQTNISDARWEVNGDCPDGRQYTLGVMSEEFAQALAQEFATLNFTHVTVHHGYETGWYTPVTGVVDRTS